MVPPKHLVSNTEHILPLKVNYLPHHAGSHTERPSPGLYHPKKAGRLNTATELLKFLWEGTKTRLECRHLPGDPTPVTEEGPPFVQKGR